MIQFDEKRIKQKEHIQRNARKYIGQIGDGTHPNDGIYTLLQELLNHFVDEFREGYGNKLEVQTHCGTVTIMVGRCFLKNGMPTAGFLQERWN